MRFRDSCYAPGVPNTWSLMKKDATRALPGLTVSLLLACLFPGALRAQTEGALDTTFSPVLTRASGFVSAVEAQADGRIVIAGSFNAVNGVARNGLARLAPDGAVDPNFTVSSICCGSGLGGATESRAPVSALAVQGDGKILIGGSFTNVNGAPRNGLARLNADGTLDTAFNPGSGLTPSGLSGSYVPVVQFLVRPNGKIVVGGYFTAVNGVPRSGLVQLNADGSVDTTFNPGTALAIGFPDFGPISSMALLPNGQVLVAGSFQAFNDVKYNGLVRLNENGSLDAAYNPAIYQRDVPPNVDGLAVLPDGSVVISGGFYEIDNEFRDGIARLLPNGTVDTTFNTTVDVANGESFRVLGLAGGAVIVHRQFQDANSTAHQVITRLGAKGTLDPAFSVELAPGPAGRLQILDTAVQPNGAWLVAGNLAAASNPETPGLVRIDTTGHLDPTLRARLELAEGYEANVEAVAVQTDGKPLLGGEFNLVNGTSRKALVRLNHDGTVDSAFGASLESDQPVNRVSELLLQPDGRILIGGLFTSVNGTNRNGLARLNLDGSLDTDFDVGTGTKGPDNVGAVTAMALQGDGKILVGGSFTTFAGQAVPNLVRLNTNGAVDLSFQSAVGQCVLCDAPDIRMLGVLSNGVVMVGGVFSKVDAFPFNGLARLQPNGAVDLTFVPTVQADEQVAALAVGADDRTVVAVTGPTTADNATRARLIRFNSDGTLDTSFKPEPVTGDGTSDVPVSAVFVDAEGRILLAGAFATVGATPRRALARLNADGTLDTTFDPGAGVANGIFPPAHRVDPLVTSFALDPDGDLVIGGAFASVNNQTRLGAARFVGVGGTTPGGKQPRLSNLTRAADGTVTLYVTGETGQSYRVEASSDLRAWTLVGTVTGGPTPQSVTDPGAKGASQRFYRAIGP